VALLDRPHGRRLHERRDPPVLRPYGDIKDVVGCETQFRAAFLLGCVGTWSLHPVQIDIAKKVFSPDPDEVVFAKKVIEAIPDGRACT
jgi:malyl-CoA/(S)-citramalyl-CoA lyase